MCSSKLSWWRNSLTRSVTSVLGSATTLTLCCACATLAAFATGPHRLLLMWVEVAQEVVQEAEVEVVQEAKAAMSDLGTSN